MPNAASRIEVRRLLEKRLLDAVRSLRELQAEGNITVSDPSSGDFVAVLQVDEHEAKDWPIYCIVFDRRAPCAWQ